MMAGFQWWRFTNKLFAIRKLQRLFAVAGNYLRSLPISPVFRGELRSLDRGDFERQG